MTDLIAVKSGAKFGEAGNRIRGAFNEPQYGSRRTDSLHELGENGGRHFVAEVAQKAG